MKIRLGDGLERMRRVWQMPAADTFDVPAIGALVRKYLRGVSVDPFARNKRWATYTNDLSPATRAEHHMQAPEFLSMPADQGVTENVVLFDPPYSSRIAATQERAAFCAPSARSSMRPVFAAGR